MKKPYSLAFLLGLCALIAITFTMLPPTASAAQDPTEIAPPDEEETIVHSVPIAVVTAAEASEEDQGFLGVYFSGETNAEGALIDRVIEGTPAQAAGMKDGDILISLNGKEVKGQDDVIAILSEAKGGDIYEYKAKRGETDVVGKVKLVSRNEYLKKNEVVANIELEDLEKQLEAHAEAFKPLEKLKGLEKLEGLKKLGYVRGIDVVESAPKGKAFLGVHIAEGQNTVKITSVIKNSPAAKAGIYCGDQIISVNGKETESVDGLTSCMAKVKVGKAVTVKLLRGNRIVKKKVKTSPADKVLGNTDKQNNTVIEKFLDGSKFGFRAAPVIVGDEIIEIVEDDCGKSCGSKGGCGEGGGCGKSGGCGKGGGCSKGGGSTCEISFDIGCDSDCEEICEEICEEEFSTDRFVTLVPGVDDDGLLSIACSGEEEKGTCRTINIPGGQARIMVLGDDEGDGKQMQFFLEKSEDSEGCCGECAEECEDVQVIEHDGHKIVIKKATGAPVTSFGIAAGAPVASFDIAAGGEQPCYCQKCSSKPKGGFLPNLSRDVMTWRGTGWEPGEGDYSFGWTTDDGSSCGCGGCGDSTKNIEKNVKIFRSPGPRALGGCSCGGSAQGCGSAQRCGSAQDRWVAVTPWGHTVLGSNDCNSKDCNVIHGSHGGCCGSQGVHDVRMNLPRPAPHGAHGTHAVHGPHAAHGGCCPKSACGSGCGQKAPQCSSKSSCSSKSHCGCKSNRGCGQKAPPSKSHCGCKSNCGSKSSCGCQAKAPKCGCGSHQGGCQSNKNHSNKNHNVYFYGPSQGSSHAYTVLGAQGKAVEYALPHAQHGQVHGQVIVEDGNGQRRVFVVRPGQEIMDLRFGDVHEHEHDIIP